MLEYIVAAFVFLIPCIIAIFFLYSQESKRKLSDNATKIPGLEPSDKKLGNFKDIEREGSLHGFLQKLHKKFGPIFGFWFGEEYIISLASPEHFKDHLKLYNRPGLLFETFKPITGKHSIQYTNGEEWKIKRKMYDKYFSHEMLKSYLSTFIQIAEDWVDKQADNGNIDLHENMMGLALKSILATAFGFKRFEEKQVNHFGQLYEEVWSELENSQFGKPPDKNSQRGKKLSQSIDNFHSYVSEVIANKRKSTDADSYVFLDYLLDNSLTEDSLMDEVITYIIGGSHTTGNLLTWTFYYLSTHSEIQDKVYDELMEILNEESLTLEKINELTYVNQVIKESIRCSVLAPYAARYSDSDIDVGKYVIPGGTPVIHALGVVLHDDNIWPEPEKFDPERFNVKNSQERPALAFPPFGFAGQRICPGQKFSIFEMVSFMSVICRAFRLKFSNDQKVERVFGLVTKPDREIEIKLLRRK